MTTPSPREAADFLDENLPWDLWKLAGENNRAVVSARVVLGHARAKDPAAGGDLAALREWLTAEIKAADVDREACRAAAPDSFRVAVSRGDALRKVRDRLLAAAPEAATEGALGLTWTAHIGTDGSSFVVGNDRGDAMTLLDVSKGPDRDEIAREVAIALNAAATPREQGTAEAATEGGELVAIRTRYAAEGLWHGGTSQGARDVGTLLAALDQLTAAWAQHFDDTAAYAGGFTEPERAGIRAAARMLRDPNVAAQVAKTVGGES